MEFEYHCAFISVIKIQYVFRNASYEFILILKMQKNLLIFIADKLQIIIAEFGRMSFFW